MTVLSQQRGASFLIDQVEPEDIVCPEDMDDDERLLMRSIKEFAEQEVEPMFDEIDRRNIDVIRPPFKKAADLGLFMAEVPEALGGLGLSLLAIAGMSESRSYLGGLSSTVFTHAGHRHAAAYQLRHESTARPVSGAVHERRSDGGVRPDRTRLRLRCHEHQDDGRAEHGRDALRRERREAVD